MVEDGGGSIMLWGPFFSDRIGIFAKVNVSHE